MKWPVVFTCIGIKINKSDFRSLTFLKRKGFVHALSVATAGVMPLSIDWSLEADVYSEIGLVIGKQLLWMLEELQGSRSKYLLAQASRATILHKRVKPEPVEI
jgi:hypothetical protein